MGRKKLFRKKLLRSDALAQRLTEATALGDRLRELRDERGVSNAELAKAMGIDESTLGQILAGDIQRPPEHRLRGAARLLQVELDELNGLIAERHREAAQEGSRWAVRVIRSGESLNGRRYPPAVLEAAVHLFEAAPVYAVSDAEHVAGYEPPLNRDVNRMVGRITGPRFVREGTGGEIRAVLEIINPAGEFGRWLVEAARRGMHEDAFGLSFTGKGPLRRGSREVREITAVESVDFVVKPAAGGRILNLIEGVEGSAVTRKATNTNTGDRDTQLIEAVSQVESSGLPKAARKRLKKKLKKSSDLTEASVRRLINDERSYVADLNEGHPGAAVTGLGGMGRVQIVQDRAERIPKMLDSFFDPKDRSVVSLKECYVEMTGDKRVSGHLRNVDRTRLSEAISIGTGSGAGVFAELLGDSITRRMQAIYRDMGVYDWWMKIATTPPVLDFREQKRVLWGGYGDLPTVAQSASYTDLTSPTDVEEVYTPAKRGGIESVSLEAIRNDDVSMVLAIPRRLSMAAKRTLSTFVAGLFTANSGAGQTLNADSLTLFHANHSNSGTAALTAASVAAGRLAMVKQTERDSSKQIGLEPKTLLVPWDLQETAHNLFRMGVNNDRDFVQGFMYDVCPVPGWTDANDWVLVADPMYAETVEVGFLDGMMEPELFVQNMETVGSLFDSDQWKWKIRHIYGATIMDHRGFYKGIVA